MSILLSTFDESPTHRRGARALVTSITVLMAGFAPLCVAGPPLTHSDQPTYPTAEDAVEALFQALQSGREQTVQKVLGADNELVSSADAAADELDRAQFLQKYHQMHRLARQSDGTKILYVGAENWPFPLPLVSDNGVWRFDPNAGAAEVLFRRIGENEITAIRACHSLLVESERSASNPGTAPGGADSLITTLLSGKESGNHVVPYHGYFFRIVSRSSGGFAAVAYPAAYRSTGIMTFFVTRSAGVNEKDLGPAGARIAQKVSKIQPDSTWVGADDATGP
jgi:hypothetical protein